MGDRPALDPVYSLLGCPNFYRERSLRNPQPLASLPDLVAI